VQRLTVSTLAELLINSVYGRGEAIKQKWIVYKTSSENRYLLRRKRVSRNLKLKKRIRKLKRDEYFDK
jgi:hypothetical protein